MANRKAKPNRKQQGQEGFQRIKKSVKHHQGQVRLLAIHFDGGCRKHPKAGWGAGYGSFQITLDGDSLIERREFGKGHSSNTAEYETLIEAVKYCLWLIPNPQLYRLEISGDSRLVINQVTGRWRGEKQHLLAKRDQTLGLLRRFAQFRLTWLPRSHSVAILGH